MKRILLTAVLSAAMTSSAFAIDPISVPDTGSTMGLFAIGMLVAVALRLKFRK